MNIESIWEHTISRISQIHQIQIDCELNAPIQMSHSLLFSKRSHSRRIEINRARVNRILLNMEGNC